MGTDGFAGRHLPHQKGSVTFLSEATRSPEVAFCSWHMNMSFNLHVQTKIAEFPEHRLRAPSAWAGPERFGLTKESLIKSRCAAGGVSSQFA